MGYQPPLPGSSRLIDWGHSWVAPPPYPYASSDIADTSIVGGQGQYPHNGEQWPWALRDALGIGTGLQFTRTYVVPSVAAGSDLTTFLDYMPEDGIIEAVWYVPNTITGVNTNTRKVQFAAGAWVGTSILGGIQFNSGVNGLLGVAIRIWSINDNVGVTNGTGTLGTNSPYFQALRGVSGSPSLQSQELYWVSTHIGTGLADNGGTVIVRYATRYRNMAVAGSTLLGGGSLTSANWATILSYSPFSRPNGVEVNITTTSSGTTLTCQPLEYPLLSGATILFPGGVTGTTTGNVGFRATSITLTGAISVTAGMQGHAYYIAGTAAGAGETISPTGINVFTYGVNDADGAVTFGVDTNAWAETTRASISKVICPVWNWPWQGNFVFVAGNGAGSAWNPLQVSSTVPPPNGLPLAVSPASFNGQPLQVWTGVVGATPPSFNVRVGPLFEGGNLDLMFLGLAGTSFGVAGTITVDGSPPPNQNPCTINTSGLSTSSWAVRTDLALSWSTGTNAVVGTGTSFGQGDVGKVLIPTGSQTGTAIPAGSIITAVTDALHITVLPPGGATLTTGTSTTCQVSGYFPMVKRITGLAAGPHTVTFTINSKDGANSAIIVYGLGIESLNPPTPVLWCNIARCPFQTTTQKNNSVTFNTASSQVIAGTYTPLAGNTQEPAFGPNVQYVDLDTLFGQNAAYFIDGLHFNSLGHRLMARTLFSIIRNNFTPDELIAR